MIQIKRKQTYERFARHRMRIDSLSIEDVPESLETWNMFLNSAKESLEIKQIEIHQMEDLVNKLQNRLK